MNPKEGAIAFPLYLQIVKGSTPEQAEPLGQRLIASFAREVRHHYDQADLDRGWLEVVDKQQNLPEWVAPGLRKLY